MLDVRSAHRARLGTFSQFRPFNSFPFFPTCIFLVVDSVSKSFLSSTRPKPAAAPLPSTQKRTRKKLKLEARCNAEQSIYVDRKLDGGSLSDSPEAREGARRRSCWIRWLVGKERKYSERPSVTTTTATAKIMGRDCCFLLLLLWRRECSPH